MLNNKPLISICIPTYHRAKYLQEAIDSALNQTYSNYEIIVVSDGFDKETDDLIYGYSNTKIKYFKKTHTNSPDTRNRSIKESKGEYILWLDDDDLLDENILSVYVSYLEIYKDVKILYCQLLAFDDKIGVIDKYNYNDWYNRKDELAAFLFVGQPIPNPGTLIHKEIFNEVGLFNTEFSRAHDYEFYSRVFIKKKFNVKFIAQALVKYRIHDKNITFKLSGDLNTIYEARILRKLLNENKLDTFFPELGKVENYNLKLSEVMFFIGLKFFAYGSHSDSIFFFTSSFKIESNLSRLSITIQNFVNRGLIKELKILLFLVKEFFLEDNIKEIVDIINNFKED